MLFTISEKKTVQEAPFEPSTASIKVEVDCDPKALPRLKEELGELLDEALLQGRMHSNIEPLPDAEMAQRDARWQGIEYRLSVKRTKQEAKMEPYVTGLKMTTGCRYSEVVGRIGKMFAQCDLLFERRGV